MVYIVMAYVVMAYMVMTYIIMAWGGKHKNNKQANPTVAPNRKKKKKKKKKYDSDSDSMSSADSSDNDSDSHNYSDSGGSHDSKTKDGKAGAPGQAFLKFSNRFLIMIPQFSPLGLSVLTLGPSVSEKLFLPVLLFISLTCQ